MLSNVYVLYSKVDFYNVQKNIKTNKTITNYNFLNVESFVLMNGLLNLNII